MGIKERIKEKGIKIVGILLGICVAAVSLFYFFYVEKAEAEKRMVEIVNYVKVQCSTYTHYNESSESKSLLRAIESARQMSTNIDMEVKNRKLYGSDGLVFIPQNLSDYQNLVNSNKYYNNDDGLCSDLPYTVPDDTKFSIKLDIEDIEILQRIQKNRYYVFYDGKHDNTPSLNFEL